MVRAVRKGLTKARILEESRALIDPGGPSALTMRALAGRLGVAPMALYNHFQDRDAILDALADSVFEQLREGFAAAGAPGLEKNGSGVKWRARLRAVILSAHRLAAEHPHVFRVAMSRPAKPASAFALAGDAVGLLEQAGLDRSRALTAYHTFVLLLQGYPFWIEGLAACAADSAPFPLLPAGRTPDREFEAIVDWLLDAIAAGPKAAKSAAGRTKSAAGNTGRKLTPDRPGSR